MKKVRKDERKEKTPAIRSIAVVFLLLAALSAVGFVGTIFSGPLGFELYEDFLLYRWAEIPRKIAAAYFMAATCGFLLAAAIVWYASNLWCWIQRIRANGREILIRLSLLTASVVGALIIMEIAVRAIDGIPIWSFENLVAKRQALLTVHTANDYDPVLGWVLKPNRRTAPDNPDSSLTTGAYGVRMNRAEIRPLPKGGILASGDSFTAGSEVGDIHTWPAQLESAIGVPVVNGGVGAWASDQIVLRAEQLIPIISPSAVIVSFFSDDIARSGYRVYGGANKPWFSIGSDGTLIHHNSPVPKFEARSSEVNIPVLGYFHLFSFVANHIGYGDWWRQFNTSYVHADNRPVEVTCRLLERLHETTRKREIPLILVLQYGGYSNLHKTKRPDIAQATVECAQADKIPVVDSWDALVEINRTDLDAYKKLYVLHDNGRVYGHMSSAGNALMAKLIAKAFRKAN